MRKMNEKRKCWEHVRDELLKRSALEVGTRDTPEGLHPLCRLCWGRVTTEGTGAQRQPMPEQGSSMKQKVLAGRNLCVLFPTFCTVSSSKEFGGTECKVSTRVVETRKEEELH